MPSFPFYFEAKDEWKVVQVELTTEQQIQRERDREIIQAIDDYYTPYRERWRQNGMLFNLIQTGTDDVISNWYMGWARLLINHSMAMLTAGDPRGDFEPVGNHDYKMRVLVNSLVEHQLNKCNWKAHQRLWIQDLHTFGNGVTESYSELPMRKKKYERSGTIVEKVVRDFRKAKVGIRRRSPFRCMRSHFITDPDDVPVSVRVEEGTWNQLAMSYGNAILPDGTPKYDMGQVPVGSHYRALHFYDENENCYRTYLITYGQRPESKLVPPSNPPLQEIGYPIYDKPLSRYKIIEQGRVLAGGANIPGMSPLAFATFEDQLDPDFETYSICGMGIPQIIAGPEAVMQALINMTIDNERLRATVPISYEPNNPDSPSALDLDVRNMYSGLVIDGKITPQPLGAGSPGANEPLWQWLKFIIYQLTGINPEPLTGDQLHTAYQSGLLVRQMNMRSQARISSWENGPLKRAFTVLGANALSEVTVEEWEEITEDDAKRIQEQIRGDAMTAQDYTEETVNNPDGTTDKVYKKLHQTMIPVKGYKFREDFTGKHKTRTLNSSSADNTLIEDQSMPGNTSYVPASSTYLLPSGSIESIMEFNVTVDGSSMLRDLKTQDMEMGKNVIMNAQAVANLDASGQFLEKLDKDKLFMASIEPAGKTEDDVFKTQATQSATQKAFQDTVKQLDQQNAQDSTQMSARQPAASGQPTFGNPSGLNSESSAEAGPPKMLHEFASNVA